MKNWTEDGFPRLTTDRLLLRELAAEDAAVLHRYWSDAAVTAYMVLEPFASVDVTARMIELLQGLPAAGQGIRWAVVRQGDGLVLGTCGFHNFQAEHRRAEVGYELGQEYWGRGLMTEALTAILGHGFGVLDLNRIEAFVNRGNVRSAALLASLGFVEEGLLREYEFARGGFVDQHCFSLLRRDFSGA